MKKTIYVMSGRKNKEDTTSIIMLNGATYGIKEVLKEQGYQFDGETSLWYKRVENSKEELANITVIGNNSNIEVKPLRMREYPNLAALEAFMDRI